MIKMKTLLPEQNSKTRYEILMDIISDFLELQKLKPELSKQDHRLNPDDFNTDDYLQSKDDDDIR